MPAAAHHLALSELIYKKASKGIEKRIDAAAQVMQRWWRCET